MATTAISNRDLDTEYGAVDKASKVRSTSDNQPSTNHNFGPAVGNFCIQYNFTAASMAVHFLTYPGYLSADYEVEPIWADDTVLAIVFLGAMIGMACMGALGDVLGRAKAMQVTLLITMLGIVVSACASGRPNVFYSVVIAGRLILGIGIGGIYPLAAVSAAEGEADSTQRSSAVSSAFIWQNVGQVVPYLLGTAMLWGQARLPPVWVAWLEFRVLLLLGIIPALIAFVAAWRTEDAKDFRPTNEIMTALRQQEPHVFSTLFGISTVWFVYDVMAYSTVIFTPRILLDMYGSSTSLFTMSWQAALTISLGIPGVVASRLLVKSWGCKNLCIVGFLASSGAFAVMALLWGTVWKNTLFTTFCILNFCIAFGPNIGTYVLPTIAFPKEIRSTCHGISGFSGKAGALLGTLLFPLISRGGSVLGVLIMQVVAGIVGAVISYFFLKHDWEYLSAE